MSREALQLAAAGKIHKLTSVTLLPVFNNEEIRTEIQAFVKDRATPVILTDIHANDEVAMHFVLQFFAAMHASGTTTSEQIASWRRGLFVVVP